MRLVRYIIAAEVPDDWNDADHIDRITQAMIDAGAYRAMMARDNPPAPTPIEGRLF